MDFRCMVFGCVFLDLLVTLLFGILLSFGSVTRIPASSQRLGQGKELKVARALLFFASLLGSVSDGV